MTWLMVCAAAAVLWACAPGGASPPRGSDQHASSGTVEDSAPVVSLERGPCFGSCPVYAVSVARSGAVQFVGRRFVRDSGKVVAAIPAARVDTLLAMIEAAGFFDFTDRYRPSEPGCDRYATDLPTVVVEVRSGMRRKRIEHDHGCTDAPPALAELERRIDSVIGTAKWTGQER